MINACIVIISSRKKCLYNSLQSLWKYFNHKNNYPVYIYYFDNIYDSWFFRRRIKKNISENIFFRKIEYQTPSFLKEDELFYNRTYLKYVKNSFPIKRKGYLHMCNFIVNIYKYPNTELHKYDYVMTHDDEAGYLKQMEKDPFNTINKSTSYFIAYEVGKRLKDGEPHQGHLDTRIGLWDFTKNFILKNNINPKSAQLSELMEDKNAEINFHYLDWCDTYIINTEMFKMDLWHKWINAINSHGGIYKYRWGDNEIYSLFSHMIQEKIICTNSVKEGFHSQGLYRNIQEYAPGVKNINK